MFRFFIALGLLAILSTAAKADLTILQLDFDSSTTPAFSQTTGNSTTPISPNGFSLSNTEGVGGSNGALVEFDTTVAGAFSTGFFTQLNDQTLGSNDLINTPTSTNLADYSFSFDARATGFAAGVTSAGGQALFQINGGNLVNNPPLTPQNITDQFQTFTFNLGSGTIDPATFFTQGSGNRPTFQIELLGVINSFGTDADNSLVVDNISIHQAVVVPEPSSIALFSIGIVGLVLRRRR